MNKEKISEEYYRVLHCGGYRILDKIVLKFSGDAENFLGPLTSNTLNAVKNCFLDRFGKIVVMFDQVRTGEDIFAIIEAKFEERLKNHLKPFLKLSRTSVENTNFKVMHVIGTEKTLGITIPQRTGFFSISEDVPADLYHMTPEVYNAFRVESGISVQGTDFDREMLLNVNWPDAVSFTKGCFLGQEIIGRVRNLGNPPKKLARILYQHPPSAVTADGKEIGKPTSVCFSPKYTKYIAFSIIPREVEKVDNGEII